MTKRRSLIWMSIAAIALTITLLTGQGWQQGWMATSGPIAQAPPPPAPAPAAAPTPALSGTYEDPQGNFQVGILDGFTVSTVSGSPLFQTQDGSVAYSVVRVPLSSDVALTDIGLVGVAQRSLGRGEAFQTQAFNPVPGGGLQIAWTGRLTQAPAPPKPLSGTVLAKQQGGTVYLLVVAALEEASAQIPQVAATLLSTLNIL